MLWAASYFTLLWVISIPRKTPARHKPQAQAQAQSMGQGARPGVDEEALTHLCSPCVATSRGCPLQHLTPRTCLLSAPGPHHELLPLPGPCLSGMFLLAPSLALSLSPAPLFLRHSSFASFCLLMQPFPQGQDMGPPPTPVP